MEGLKAMLGRLRAALTPQALTALLAALALIAFSGAWGRTSGEDLEARISETLSRMEGAGHVQVVIFMRERETASGTLSASGAQAGEVPCGAVAVAEGAGDPLVRLELEQALGALRGLPASAVSVVTGLGGS